MTSRMCGEFVEVSFRLPRHVWGALVQVAERKQFARVDELAASLLTSEARTLGNGGVVSPAMRSRLARLCSEGLGLSAIAARTGHGVEVVRRMLSQAGLETVRQRSARLRREARSKTRRAA